MVRYLLILSVLILPGYSTAVVPDCDAVELIEHQEEYNSLVCLGEKYFRVGLYKKAVDQYLDASAVKFHESPNYRLNARIAHAYLLMGDIEKASHYIKRSELTLSLLAGIYSCEEGNNGIAFFISDGKGPVVSVVGNDVVSVMCGGAYQYIYNDRFKSFSAVVLEGRLSEYHTVVAKLIEERKSLGEK